MKDGGLQKRYDQMWSSSIEAIWNGEIEPDPILAARTPDRRRGLTLIARPSAEVRGRIVKWLGQLRRAEPDQYYYAPSELHLTILPLFTATTEPKRFLADKTLYMTAVDQVVHRAKPMRIEFKGVTASRGAILIQGFTQDESLNDLRDALRKELSARGIGDSLDTRYRLETAHITVARFRADLRDGPRLAALLERARNLPFGKSQIKSLTLVKNDWYMSRRVVQTVNRYPLRPQRVSENT